jgi:hypothetical protein
VHVRWRVFVGLWNGGEPTVTFTNHVHDDWREARRELVFRLRRELVTGSGSDRREAAAGLLAALALRPGESVTVVAGYDYVLVGV